MKYQSPFLQEARQVLSRHQNSLIIGKKRFNFGIVAQLSLSVKKDQKRSSKWRNVPTDSQGRLASTSTVAIEFEV